MDDAAFAAVKGLEYWLEWRDGIMPGVNGSGFESRVQELFMDLYFVATRLHAVHLTIGIVMLLALAALAGPLRPVVSYGIATAKAALILWFFMEMRREGGLARLAALAGFAWLAILFILVASDYLTRGWTGGAAIERSDR